MGHKNASYQHSEDQFQDGNDLAPLLEADSAATGNLHLVKKTTFFLFEQF